MKKLLFIIIGISLILPPIIWIFIEAGVGLVEIMSKKKILFALGIASLLLLGVAFLVSGIMGFCPFLKDNFFD